MRRISCFLLMLTLLLTTVVVAWGTVPTDGEVTPSLVNVSRSKTATVLDKDYRSTVTLSLPSAEEKLASDVVFVLDKSTSAELEDKALALLADLKEEVRERGVMVKVGVVIFNREANVAFPLTELTKENYIQRQQYACGTSCGQENARWRYGGRAAPQASDICQ